MFSATRFAALIAATVFAAAPLFAATTATPAPAKTTPAAEVPAGKAGARFDSADTNADGKLDAAELAAMNPKFDAARFARLDVDGDGGISRGEMQQAHAARAAQGQSPMAGTGESAAGAGLRDRFAAMDSDGDGALTREEIGDQAPRLTQRFTTLDADGDGRITGSEMRAARAAKAPGKP